MALVAKSIGWQPPEENDFDQRDRFLIVLEAETKDDVPQLPAGVVWGQTPLSLTVAE